jgi:hypothetical protein
MQQNVSKPPVIDVVQAGRWVGLSRSAAYSAADSGELLPGVPVFRVGQRKLMVSTAALEAALGTDVMALIENETDSLAPLSVGPGLTDVAESDEGRNDSDRATSSS